jgi:hypothetical protein
MDEKARSTWLLKLPEALWSTAFSTLRLHSRSVISQTPFCLIRADWILPEPARAPPQPPLAIDRVDWEIVFPSPQAAAFIVPDMVNDEIAAQILQPFCGCYPVLGCEIVAHDLDPKILAA